MESRYTRLSLSSPDASASSLNSISAILLIGLDKLISGIFSGLESTSNLGIGDPCKKLSTSSSGVISPSRGILSILVKSISGMLPMLNL